ncbi:30S ribosomal protein S7 [Candidatus Nitrospira inopinata]|jgi:small subunit ribosomal protein S7|uniref:Small ribosomal subunit protein uS7 n=1 Tax=Candidatus Nitrospira inopinata TaxID=1715989 RepID=A0A0S4KQJ0_9BACT|nr:30S ribosomal protein S7 [Candidatus Nitrospira inopinata]CUQ66700.1 30S ribosomal subunit protein S7 [Candidatus Nitrospira inopinata]
MPRSKFFGQREVLPDVRYRDKLVGKFINALMTRGKKSVTERICYGAFDVIQEKTGNDPLKVFKAAVDNVKPIVEVKSRRVGGASYQVPVEIRPSRRVSLALRWLSQCARTRSGKSMREKLAAELLDAANNTGASVKKREDVHRMAEANKAFAHYRW